jgi:hypothetical protein
LGNLGCRGLPRLALLLRDIQLRLSQWGYWVPLFTIWDPVAGPGRTPMPGNNSGLSHPARPPGQQSLGKGLGSEGFWIGDYGGGSPGRPPFWRTLMSPVRGLAR